MIGIGLHIGNRVMGGAAFDVDAQAFFDRVTVAGGTLTTTEKNATNQLVLDMKSAGIWSAMKAVYPMVGASAAACAQNLKSSSFTGTFSSGWTFASTGVTPNGTSAYTDTGFNPITQLSSNSNFHLSNYSPIHSTGTSKTYIGSTSGASGTFNATSIGLYTGGSVEVGQVSSLTFAEYGGQISAFGGMQNVSVNGSRVNKYYKNGVLSGVQTTGTGVFDNVNIYLAASVISGSLGLYDDKEHRFNSIGDGLTDTQASNFYTAVQAFQTTLSRQV